MQACDESSSGRHDLAQELWNGGDVRRSETEFYKKKRKHECGSSSVEVRWASCKGAHRRSQAPEPGNPPQEIH